MTYNWKLLLTTYESMQGSPFHTPHLVSYLILVPLPFLPRAQLLRTKNSLLKNKGHDTQQPPQHKVITYTKLWPRWYHQILLTTNTSMYLSNHRMYSPFLASITSQWSHYAFILNTLYYNSCIVRFTLLPTMCLLLFIW